MMQREKWAMDMAKDASQLPGGYFGGDIYSAHPNDSTGTWRGDAAVISQIDAMALAKKYRGGAGHGTCWRPSD